jgi:hypothetical protein
VCAHSRTPASLEHSGFGLQGGDLPFAPTTSELRRQEVQRLAGLLQGIFLGLTKSDDEKDGEQEGVAEGEEHQHNDDEEEDRDIVALHSALEVETD